MYCSCSLCGAKLVVEWEDGDPRDKGPCSVCGAVLKEREAAHALLSIVALGRFVSLASYVRDRHEANAGEPTILDIAYSSPFSKHLGQLPGYTQGYFWSSGEAEVNRSGIELPYVDLQRTTFADESFDIVITHDSLAFIEDIELALAEMARILSPGGVCISIAKVDWPIPTVTEDHPLGPGAQMYKTPEGNSMVLRRRLGADLADRMQQQGLRAIFRRLNFHSEQRRNITIIGVKG